MIRKPITLALFVFKLFLLNDIKGFCQNRIFDEGTHLKRGIYKNISEFKFNNPSWLLPFESDTVKVKFGVKTHVFYKLLLPKEHQEVVSNAFGYCDGRDVYIRINIKNDKNVSIYSKMQSLGRYSHFKNIELIDRNIGSNNAVLGIYRIPQLTDYLLDFNDGDNFRVTKEKAKEIVGRDDELSNRFEECTGVNDYLNLILEYSDNHKDDAFGLESLKNVNRLIYFDQSVDHTFEKYYERVKKYSLFAHIMDVQLSISYFVNGQVRSIGLKCKSLNTPDPDNYYKIGTWRSFHKNGMLKDYSDYNFREQRNGVNRTYDESGELLKDRLYVNGKRK